MPDGRVIKCGDWRYSVPKLWTGGAMVLFMMFYFRLKIESSFCSMSLSSTFFLASSVFGSGCNMPFETCFIAVGSDFVEVSLGDTEDRLFLFLPGRDSTGVRAKPVFS